MRKEYSFEVLAPIGTHVNMVNTKTKQEAQGLGALLDKMEDNNHIKLDNIDLDVSFTPRPAIFEAQGF